MHQLVTSTVMKKQAHVKFPINVPTIECLKKVYKERCGIQVSSDSGSLLWPRLAEPDDQSQKFLHLLHQFTQGEK